MGKIEEFIKRSKLDIKKYDAYMYGYPEIADQILECLLRGDKRATTGLYDFYLFDKEPLPKVGDISIILDSKENPKCITRITKTEIVRFCDITKEYAYVEGEGDKSLEYWKRCHKEVFTRECLEDYNIQFNEEMKCYCEYFEVIYKE